MEEPVKEDEKPIHHGAAFKLIRLHQHWVDVSLASRKNDYIGWKLSLDCIYREFVSRMNDDENKEYKRVILAVVSALKTFQLSFGKGVEYRKKVCDTAYSACFDYEVFLRRVESRLGLDMKMMEPFDIGEGA